VFATRTIVVALVVGTGITVIAGLVPAFRATRVAPVIALREAGQGSRKVGIVGRVIRPLVSVLGRPGERIAGASACSHAATRCATRAARRPPRAR
jgi:putative ABC transport system permease protein